MQNRFVIACIGTLLLVSAAIAQLPDETNGRVPELDAFHKPIYTLWHKAWPDKDIAQLKKLLPDVEAAYAKLAAAKLPGILRDKQAVWDEKLKTLSQAMEAYKTSVAADDAEGILKATENVHMFYEGMVRIVRPVIRQLDEFHQVLYLVHHYYMPEYNLPKLKESADQFIVRMDSLKAAALPKRHEAKKEQFDKARQGLDIAVKAFVEAIKAGADKEALLKLEETMHVRYQMVEKIFE